MFGRQTFGTTFQPFGFGSPLQMPTVNPFQPLTVGLSPFGIGTGFVGVTPLTPPLSGLGASLFGGGQGIGFNPFISSVAPFFGANLTPFSTGLAPTINPLITAQLAATNPVLAQLIATNPMLAQLAATNPMLISHLAQQTAGGIGALTGQPYTGQPYIGAFAHPITQLLGGGAGQFGGQPFGSPFGFASASQWSTPYSIGAGPLGQPTVGTVNPSVLAQMYTNPALATDPVVSLVLAQQLNPLAQQQLPIRPLISAQQFDPSQVSLPGIAGAIAGQVTDPYSTFVQAQLIPQLAASPFQQMHRAYTGAPWITGVGVPSPIGPVLPSAQVGIPLGF